jgi:hypothetical protein
MIDCFVCVNPVSELRFGMAVASIEAWRHYPVALTILHPTPGGGYYHPAWNTIPKIGVTGEFQVERRVIADTDGTSIYILADDDCLFLSSVGQALELMRVYPDFAILSALPINAKINRWNPENHILSHDCSMIASPVVEHTSVGGIRFCRKGALKEWPAFRGPGYDREHCEALRDAGWRVGYMNDVKMNHLGEGASTVWTKQLSSGSHSG